MEKKTLSIIGFGNFGQYMAALLKDKFQVKVYDNGLLVVAAQKLGVNK